MDVDNVLVKYARLDMQCKRNWRVGKYLNIKYGTKNSLLGNQYVFRRCASEVEKFTRPHPTTSVILYIFVEIYHNEFKSPLHPIIFPSSNQNFLFSQTTKLNLVSEAATKINQTTKLKISSSENSKKKLKLFSPAACFFYSCCRNPDR